MDDIWHVVDWLPYKPSVGVDDLLHVVDVVHVNDQHSLLPYVVSICFYYVKLFVLQSTLGSEQEIILSHVHLHHCLSKGLLYLLLRSAQRKRVLF